jgi:hypothetical protein
MGGDRMGAAEMNIVTQVRGPAMSGRAGDGPGVSCEYATDASTAGNLAELVGQVLPIWEMHIETSRALAEDSIEGLATSFGGIIDRLERAVRSSEETAGSLISERIAALSASWRIPARTWRWSLPRCIRWHRRKRVFSKR